MFLIKIYSDDVLIIDAGAEYSNAPDEPMLFATLRRLLMSCCVTGAEKISVQIWDQQRQAWHHPGGKRMDDSWDGTLPVRVEVKIGSANL